MPEGPKQSYSTADVWNDFLNIVEADLSSVADILANGNDEVLGCYSTDGKQIPTLPQGVNIIRYVGGIAKKGIVR